MALGPWRHQILIKKDTMAVGIGPIILILSTFSDPGSWTKGRNDAMMGLLRAFV